MTTNLGLTEKGRDEIKNLINQNREKLSIARRIISSPYKRAVETSEIIARAMNVPIIISEKIVEFNSGILEGNTHEENAKMYPEYYKIWMERKDLDGIPGAEKGCELQARAVAFLMNYYERDEFTDIVVSHAGFLRCLINTSRGLYRTTAVDSRNGAINIIDEPLKYLDIERKNRAMTSKVFIVKTLEGKYVVKLKNRGLLPEDYEEKRILDQIGTDLGYIPIVLSLTGTDRTSTKVLSFVRGSTIFGILDQMTEQALIEKFCKMRDVLSQLKTYVYNPKDILAEVEELEAKTKHAYVKKYGQDILRDKFNKLKLESSRYCLIHNDLNRDNILFDRSKNGTVQANIIDWEGMGLYPYDYQLASFLVTAFLLEGYSMENIMEIAKKVETNIDENFLTYLMKFRIFKGLHFFAESKNSYTMDNQNISCEILKKYFFAAEKLEKYRTEHNFTGIGGNLLQVAFESTFQIESERDL